MLCSCVKDVLKKLTADKTKLRKLENSPRKCYLMKRMNREDFEISCDSDIGQGEQTVQGANKTHGNTNKSTECEE